MLRRLIANSICQFLVCAVATISTAQDAKPRESSDPYFQTGNSWSSSPQPNRVTQNSLQPRSPVTKSPATISQLVPPQQQAQPQVYPLRPKSKPAEQLQPRQTAQLQTNNDFRPRSVQSTRLDDPRFADDNNAFRPRQTPSNNNQLQPITSSNTRKPLFEEVTPKKSLKFEQTKEFETPSVRQATQPSPRERPAPSNRQRDFTQATASSAGMMTSTKAETQNGGDEFEPGRVVAIVGGKPIFVGDMLFEINQRLNQMMPGAPQKVKDSMKPEAIKRMIPQYIDAKLLLIDTLDSLPDGADFDDVVESAAGDFDEKVLPTIMEKSDVQSPLELDAKLRAQGGSLRQLRYKWSEEQIIKFFIGKKLNVNTDVSHQEMLADYQSNIDQYRQKAKVRWEELSVRFDKVPNRTEAEQMLKKMGNEVVHGAKFNAVAKRSSQGFTAYEGGKHDWTSLGSLVYKDVESALFAIPVFELSDVIASKDGLHIVRVLERTQETFTPFLEAQVEIRVKIENEKRSQAFEDHLTKLRRRIPFEVQMEGVQLPEHLADQGSNFR